MIWSNVLLYVCATLIGITESLFDQEDLDKIGASGIYGAGSPNIYSPKTQAKVAEDTKEYNKIAIYGSPSSADYVDVGVYAEHEIRQILNGKYDHPEPLYDKSIPGFLYSDKRREFQRRRRSAHVIDEHDLNNAYNSNDVGNDHNKVDDNPVKVIRIKRETEDASANTGFSNPLIEWIYPEAIFTNVQLRDKRSTEESKKKTTQPKKGVAQDYYGAIINTREQSYGRVTSQQIEKFKQLTKNPSYLDAISGLFEALVEKKRFRMTAFKLIESIIGDISVSRREQEKREKEEREERKKEATVEEDDDVKETTEKPKKEKKVKKSETQHRKLDKKLTNDSSDERMTTEATTERTTSTSTSKTTTLSR